MPLNDLWQICNRRKFIASDKFSPNFLTAPVLCNALKIHINYLQKKVSFQEDHIYKKNYKSFTKKKHYQGFTKATKKND